MWARYATPDTCRCRTGQSARARALRPPVSPACVAACVAATDGHAAPTPIGDTHEARAACPTPTPPIAVARLGGPGLTALPHQATTGHNSSEG